MNPKKRVVSHRNKLTSDQKTNQRKISATSHKFFVSAIATHEPEAFCFSQRNYYDSKKYNQP